MKLRRILTDRVNSKMLIILRGHFSLIQVLTFFFETMKIFLHHRFDTNFVFVLSVFSLIIFQATFFLRTMPLSPLTRMILAQKARSRRAQKLSPLSRMLDHAMPPPKRRRLESEAEPVSVEDSSSSGSDSDSGSGMNMDVARRIHFPPPPSPASSSSSSSSLGFRRPRYGQLSKRQKKALGTCDDDVESAIRAIQDQIRKRVMKRDQQQDEDRIKSGLLPTHRIRQTDDATFGLKFARKIFANICVLRQCESRHCKGTFYPQYLESM